ncbi:hypothetical protein VPH35_077887 [Triticum aestivum]
MLVNDFLESGDGGGDSRSSSDGEPDGPDLTHALLFTTMAYPPHRVRLLGMLVSTFSLAISLKLELQKG